MGLNPVNGIMFKGLSFDISEAGKYFVIGSLV